MKTASILNRAFRKLMGDPLVRESLIVAENESYTKRIQNLVNVERYSDACDLFDELVSNMIGYWKKDSQNPLYLHLLSKTSMETKLASRGITIIELAISRLSDKAMDFTQIFLDLGTLYRLSGKSLQEELDCYIKSVTSMPPENGLFAASRKLKAEACYRTYKVLDEMGLSSQADIYLKKADALSDGIKLQYDFATREFFSDERGSMTPEVLNRIGSRIKDIDILG